MRMRNLEIIIDQWTEEAKISTPVTYEMVKDDTLIIHTTQPGIMIGKEGELINKYLELIKKLHRPKVKHFRFGECTIFKIPENEDTTIHEKAKRYKFTKYDYNENSDQNYEHVFYIESQYLEYLYNRGYARKYSCFDHFLNDKDPEIAELLYFNAFSHNAIISERIKGEKNMLVRRIWFKKKWTKQFYYVYKISGWFLFGIIPVFIYKEAESVREE